MPYLASVTPWCFSKEIQDAIKSNTLTNEIIYNAMLAEMKEWFTPSFYDNVAPVVVIFGAGILLAIFIFQAWVSL